MRKILITGYKGYIGQHLCKMLSTNTDIEIIGIDKLDNVVDILYNVPNIEVDTVIHLAALVKVGESVEKPTMYYNTNINGTNNVLSKIKYKHFIKNIKICNPLQHNKLIEILKNSKLVITDSGGIQEESTFVGKPCLTLRPNTERPVTLEIGTNTLIKWEVNEIIDCIQTIKNKTYKTGKIPPFWDGQSTRRILDVLAKQ